MYKINEVGSYKILTKGEQNKECVNINDILDLLLIVLTIVFLTIV